MMREVLNKRILIMAGGTGGHVIPALVVAQQLKEQGSELAWLGTGHGLEAKLVPAADIRLYKIAIKGLRKSGIKRRLFMPWRLTYSLWQSWRVFRRFRPDAVLGMGGFVAGPGGVVACLLRVPLVLHEQNSVPGLTNKLLSRFAKKVFTAFPTTVPPLKAAVAAGNPIWPQIANLPSPAQRYQQRQGPIHILVLGGSRGALALNKTLPAAFRLLNADNITIWHQCGADHLEQSQQFYQQQGMSARVEPFINDMAAAYAWADLVICRAGSMTVMELAAVGIAAIFIPYPYAVDHHQQHNADYLVRLGAAKCLSQQQLTADNLAADIDALLDRQLLLQMAECAKRIHQQDATKRLVESLLHVR